MSDKKGVFGPMFDVLGGICAFLTVAVYAVLVINAHWDFLGTGTVYNILVVIKTWAPLVIVAITGLEFCSGKNLTVKILFLILCAVVVLSMFFPSTWEKVVGVIKTGN